MGAGGLGSPAALYLAAAGRRHAGHRRHGRGRSLEPAAPGDPHPGAQGHGEDRERRRGDQGAQPRREGGAVPGAAHLATTSTAILGGFDLVLDGGDNFPTRYLLNDACVKHKQAQHPRVDLPVRGPGHDLHPLRRGPATAACTRSRRRRTWRRRAPRPACSACCPGIVGLFQANEAIKLILGHGRAAHRPAAHARRARAPRFRTLKLRRDPKCPVCSEGAKIEYIDYEQFCAAAA